MVLCSGSYKNCRKGFFDRSGEVFIGMGQGYNPPVIFYRKCQPPLHKGALPSGEAKLRNGQDRSLSLGENLLGGGIYSGYHHFIVGRGLAPAVNKPPLPKGRWIFGDKSPKRRRDSKKDSRRAHQNMSGISLPQSPSVTAPSSEGACSTLPSKPSVLPPPLIGEARLRNGQDRSLR